MLRFLAVAGIANLLFFGLYNVPTGLIVAHGALFRALRAEMGLIANVRTPNATPLFCQPGAPWTLTPAAGEERSAN